MLLLLFIFNVVVVVFFNLNVLLFVNPNMSMKNLLIMVCVAKLKGANWQCMGVKT